MSQGSFTELSCFNGTLFTTPNTHHNITNIVKVLDDFLFIGNSYEECNTALNTFLAVCTDLGVPIANDKTVGPTKSLSFLGITLNTHNLTAALPIDKVNKYLDHTKSLLFSTHTSLRDLKSLIGKLQFATYIFFGGACYLRTLHDATIGKRKPSAKIRISKNMKEDLLTWYRFLLLRNYKPICSIKPAVNSNDINFYSDSSPLGYGATFKSKYIQGTLPSSWKTKSIQLLELYPIFIMVQVFAPQIEGTNLVFFSDNEAIVAVINKLSSPNKLIMSLIRPTITTLLKFNISFRAEHIPGKLNILCDKLSRQKASPQLLREYGMDLSPTPVPLLLRPHNYRL